MKVAKVSDAGVLAYEQTDVKTISGGGGRHMQILESADITKLILASGEPLRRYA